MRINDFWQPINVFALIILLLFFTMHTIEGDLLQVDCDYIAHQCNCLTIRSHGLAKQIAERFPKSDIYATRMPVAPHRNRATKETQSCPGTIAVTPDNVICMFAQWRPGRMGTRYWSSYEESEPKETPSQRLKWFRMCLALIGIALQDCSIAFPHGIGCGLAGGEWSDYFKVLQEFDEAHPSINVSIVRKSPAQ